MCQDKISVRGEGTCKKCRCPASKISNNKLHVIACNSVSIVNSAGGLLHVEPLDMLHT